MLVEYIDDILLVAGQEITTILYILLRYARAKRWEMNTSQGSVVWGMSWYLFYEKDKLVYVAPCYH